MISFKKLIFMIPVLVVLLGGCQSPLSQLEKAVGRVSLTVLDQSSQEARLLKPSGLDFVIVKYELIFSKAGSSDLNFELTAGTVGSSVTVPLGTYTLTVKGYNAGNAVVGLGSTSITVNAGNNTANVTLQAVVGNGSFQLVVSTEGLTLSAPSMTATLTKVGGSPVALTFTAGNNSFVAEQSVPNGYYDLSATLKDGATTVAKAIETVFVVTDAETKGGMTFLISGTKVLASITSEIPTVDEDDDDDEEIAYDGIRVYWKGYSNIHYWAVVATPAIAATAWPGQAVEPDLSGWRAKEFPKATSVNIVFNSPGQTADLSRVPGENGNWWYKDGAWTNYNPEGPVTPGIQASPVPGKYNTIPTVTLQGSNAGDIIYYTKDGSTPTEGSLQYSNGIVLANAAITTIKAFGKNSAGVVGPISSFVYDVNTNYDLTAPNITASSNSGTYPESILVQFTVTDNMGPVTAYYTNDGSTPTTSSPIYTSGAGTSATGSNINVASNIRFNFLVVDGAGNSFTKSFNYNIGASGRGDFREETIYFLMTTRFYDGDLSNNFRAWDDAQAGNPASDPAWRGDFKGLVEKLDYIKALGFSAVWVTPVVKNMSGYDYHGYHAVNHSVVDPRYESAGYNYQRLIDEAHARGMKIVQDVVVNHTGNFGEENLHPLFNKDASGSYKNSLVPSLHEPNALLEQGAQVMGGTYATLTPANQFQARIKAQRAPLDVDVHYHNHEFKGGWEQYEVQIGSIAGDCQDLNTENPVVSSYLRDAYTGFIDMGVDAFRVDTVKHISRLTFNNEFVPQWKQAGGENFFIFGEVATRYRNIWNSGIPAISTPFYTWKYSNGKFDSTYAWGSREVNEASVFTHYNDNSSTAGAPVSDNHLLLNNTYRSPDWSKKSGMDVIDFPMHWAFNNISDAWSTAVGGDWAYNDATFNVTYIDSHDYAPDGAPENQRYTGSWPEKLSLIFTFRGIPTLYYGSEIEFKKGAVIDVGPNAPLASTGRAYFGDHIEGSVNVSDFGKYTNASGAIATTLSHPLATHVRALNLIRRAVPALQKGQYSTDSVSGSMAFRRRFTDGDVDSFALVALDGSATFTGVPNGTYRDVVTGQSHTVSNGTASLSAAGTGNLRVWVLYGGSNQQDPGHVLAGMFPLTYIK